MPRENRSPTDPREWLIRARSNLLRARKDARLRGVVLEDLCFDAQQAAEKAIKAVFLHRGQAFPYVHDLGELLSLLQQAGDAITSKVREAGRPTRYAVVTRYPGLAGSVAQEEYQQAVKIAGAVVRWAEGRIKGRR